ncbi:MAG: response regulator, partial [Desulfobacterales bacterium]|nr:response regulator [Desulfobacterales bacterium]
MGKTKKARILIVDDIPKNIHALVLTLKRPDLEIFTATSGNDALALMLEYNFDLVILDIQMPEMNGFEVAEIMRSDKQTRDIPILFATAVYSQKEFISKGYEAGAVDYLLKPIDADILKMKVNAILSMESSGSALKETIEELKPEVGRRKKAEKALHVSEERFRSLVETTSDWIWEMD